MFGIHHNLQMMPIFGESKNIPYGMNTTCGLKLPFPFKLHEMLEDSVRNGTESIVSWQPHGKAFRVHKPIEFVQCIMPTYFQGQTKYKSFQRQLHIYGFQRITKGLDKGAYHHALFVKEKKSTSLQMTRCKIKGALSMAKEGQEEPDFYLKMNLNKTIEKSLELSDHFVTEQSRPAFPDLATYPKNPQEMSIPTSLVSGFKKETQSLPSCPNSQYQKQISLESYISESLLETHPTSRQTQNRDDIIEGDEVLFGDKKFFFVQSSGRRMSLIQRRISVMGLL